MKNQLIIPVALYVFYMWCLTVYMFRSRVKAIKKNHDLMKYYKMHLGETRPPENTIVIGRHYDNQFQVPLLFMITCLFHLSLGMVNSTTVFLAWAFVVSRAFHSWVHLGSNHVRSRAYLFGIGWIVILLMWVQLIYLAI